MKTGIVIAVLIASNIALAGVIADQKLRDVDEIYADHVQQLRLDAASRVLRVRLGKSDTPGGAAVISPEFSGELLLTPRAAIQLDVNLRQMIAMIHQEAARQDPAALAETPRSPD